MLPITGGITREEETENTYVLMFSSFFSPNGKKKIFDDICDNS